MLNENPLEEIKVELETLLRPLFTYHEIIDWQERMELNNESKLEKATREQSLIMARDNHRRIVRILRNVKMCEERYLFQLVYAKLYDQLILPPGKQDYTYDYLCLVNICKKIIN